MEEDPQVRTAKALEAIASALESIAFRIEEHADNLNYLARMLGEAGDEIVRAMRGEPRPEEQ